MQIKVALCLSLFAAAPYIAYVGWQFLVPALYPHEKRHIKRLACVSSLLFLAGVAFCLFFIIPAMMKFSFQMQNESMQQTIGLSQYIGLVAMLMLGFGFVFQLPILIFFLVISGIISLQTLKKQRPVVLVAILTISALLTPPDVFSQFMMAIPTYMLFEISLLAAAATQRKKTAAQLSSHDEPQTAALVIKSESASISSPQPQADDSSSLSPYSVSHSRRRKLKAGPRRFSSRRRH